MRRLLARARRRLASDRGALAPFAAILIPALLVLGGLVVDGTRELNARAQAQAFAEEAARAGASAVQVDSEELALDDTLVRQRVADYCDRVIGNGLVDAGGCYLVGITAVSSTDDRQIKVTVHVDTSIDTSLLGIVGIRTLTASAEGSARPYQGVDGTDAN